MMRCRKCSAKRLIVGSRTVDLGKAKIWHMDLSVFQSYCRMRCT
jgi:hypothetical protein